MDVQENEVHQILWNTNISYHLIHAHIYQLHQVLLLVVFDHSLIVLISCAEF